MKKVYFLTDGIVERQRNWGSKIDSIVEDVLKKQDYEFYSFYLTKELDKLGKPTFINDSPKINIVSIRLNLAKKFFSWILNLFSVFHFFEKKYLTLI